MTTVDLEAHIRLYAKASYKLFLDYFDMDKEIGQKDFKKKFEQRVFDMLLKLYTERHTPEKNETTDQS